MYVSLNISNTSIRILSLKGRKVKKWGGLALEEGLVLDGLVLNPQAVGEAIVSLFKKVNLPKENVIISLAGMSFTYRFVDLPVMKPASVEEAITRVAKKEISMPLEELYLSWQPLPSHGQEQSYFLLGVARNIVDAMVETLNIAGITPYLMDLRPLALARAANRGDAIVVNMDDDCFDIVFIADGLPRVIHSISPRGDGATLEDNIQRVIDGLNKTVVFYQSSHPESRPGPETPLLLTGELTEEAIRNGLLQSGIEYSIERLNPPVDYPPDFSVDPYTVNIGLALKKTPLKTASQGDVSRFTDININLLDGKYRKKKAPPLPFRRILLGILLALAVIALFPLYQARSQVTAENADLQTELDGINRELNLANLIAEETALTRENIDKITAATEALQEANRGILVTRGDFTGNLNMVTEVLPPGTRFTSIDIDSQAISVKGDTDSVFTAVDYATALENTGVFQEVRIVRLDEAINDIPEISENETMQAEAGSVAFDIIIDKEIPEVISGNLEDTP
jgi:type IV pilus assembly protein PilM